MASLWTLNRRQLLQLGAAGVASSAQPCLGLIFPRSNSPVLAEAHTAYPNVRFLSDSFSLPGTLPEEFDLLAGRINPIAVQLSSEGANAIVLMAPSLSFYRGAAFNQKLSEQLTKAAGMPVITASTAIVAALNLRHARRIAVATSYTNEINLKLQGFLNEFGYEVLILRGTGTERFEERIPVTEALSRAEITEFITGVRENRPEADTLLIAFGSHPTFDMIVPLEKRCRIPVVSANQCAIAAGVRSLSLPT
jgi:arylmalonate decarboxylase